MGERAPFLARRVEPVAGPVPGGGGGAHSAHPRWHLRAAVAAAYGAITPEEARAGGMNPQMLFNSFLGDTKLAIEMAAIATRSASVRLPAARQTG